MGCIADQTQCCSCLECQLWLAQNEGWPPAFLISAYPAYGYGPEVIANSYKPPRQRKLESAKAWLKEHGSHPGCLDRFMKERGMA